MNIMSRIVFAAIAVTALLFSSGAWAAQLEADTADVPVKGMVTVVDLGAKKCIPCRMMAPILEKLEAEYRGRAAIRFIDVWENPEAGKPFGIELIPTQIFYDAQGRETWRHEGFLAEEAIRARLAELGVE